MSDRVEQSVSGSHIENFAAAFVHSLYQPVRGGAQLLNHTIGSNFSERNPAPNGDPNDNWTTAGAVSASLVEVVALSKIMGWKIAGTGSSGLFRHAVRAAAVGGLYEMLSPVESAGSSSSFWAQKLQRTTIGASTFATMGAMGSYLSEGALATRLLGGGNLLSRIGCSTTIGALSGMAGGTVHSFGSDLLYGRKVDLGSTAKEIGEFTLFGAALGLGQGVFSAKPAGEVRTSAIRQRHTTAVSETTAASPATQPQSIIPRDAVRAIAHELQAPSSTPPPLSETVASIRTELSSVQRRLSITRAHRLGFEEALDARTKSSPPEH